MQDETGMAVVWITHDLGVVARLADRVVVMYAGRVVEQGTTQRIFTAPRHPYTQGLLASLPRGRGGTRRRLAQIPGSPPDVRTLGAGCAFAPRCAYAVAACAGGAPEGDQRRDPDVACWVLPSWEAA
jgi:oligopeptide/dipeptide ABC transporter ATP-binding protein